MSEPVKVINLLSSSYTGTTWLNFAIASHPAAMYLGPYDRMRSNLDEMGQEACRIHGKDCDFWPGFLRGYDPARNFFSQLAAYSGKQYFVINNPLDGGAYAKDLDSPEVEEIPFLVVRDLRALFASKLRKDKETNPVQILNDFVGWCASRPMEIMQKYEHIAGIRYEDARRDLGTVLRGVGQRIGLQYHESAQRFWTFDHHPVAGNHGPSSFVAFYQGKEYVDFVGRKHYQEQFQEMQGGGRAPSL